MKNILVPTDLSLQSLQVIHQIVQKNQGQLVNIFLVHMVKVPTDITDLMFLKKSRLYDNVPHDFFQAINNLRSEYPSRIGSIRFEFYYGHRAGILSAIVENLQIDEICILNGYTYSLPLEESVNMMPLIDRCQIPVFKATPYGKVTLRGLSKKPTAEFVPNESYSAALQ